MNILSKDILPLKTSQKFSSVLEPYAGKVASTVLRRECHCEVMFLSDNINDFDAKIGEQWNREDIKEQLKDCHTRIKSGETEFEQKITQDNI